MLTILRPFIMKGDISFDTINKKLGEVITFTGEDTSRLKSIYDEFKFYTGKYANSTKYKNLYNNYISQHSDGICNLGNKTIFELIDLVINGYYFHSDLEKQKEIIDFVKEHKNKWLGLLREDELSEEDVIVIRERIRETFKFRFYELIIGITNCVFELKYLIEELFGLPLDEELHQESRILYDFLDI
ncbi:MAG: hypothetical protein NHB32_09310 [Fischerella sp. CENA71]|nr:hypothetical protein [Fischerella sp. CENA71]